jgi:DNA-directed RNA polymerase specialized sigma24 family protein
MTATCSHTPSFLPGVGPRVENQLTQEDRHALVLNCLNLCRSLARSAGATVPYGDSDDLYGEAVAACVEAATTWTPGGDAKFSTFATSYIRKKLLGLAAEQRLQARAVRLSDWGRVQQPETSGDAAEADPIAPDDTDRLAKLDEPARSAVRLIVFGGETPSRAAEQCGLSLKDLMLCLRNSALTLQRRLARDRATPALFGPPAGPCEFCGGGLYVCEGCYEAPTECLCPITAGRDLIPCPDCGTDPLTIIED